MEKEIEKLPLPQRAKKQLVRAEPKASVEGKVPLAEMLKDEPVLWLQPDGRAHLHLFFGRRRIGTIGECYNIFEKDTRWKRFKESQITYF